MRRQQPRFRAFLEQFRDLKSMTFANLVPEGEQKRHQEFCFERDQRSSLASHADRIIDRYLFIMQIAMGQLRYTAPLVLSAVVHGLIVLATDVAAVPSRPATPNARAIAVVALAPTDDSAFPGLQPFTQRPPPAELIDGVPQLALGAVRVDIRKIAGRIHLLFPVLSPGLALDSFFPRPRALSVPGDALGLTNRSGQDQNPDLALGERALQSVVDRSWSRRARWQAFQVIAHLMDGHSAGGALPRLLRAYSEQNALQPYEDRDSRDPRLWAQLSLAADHVSFIGFIRTFVASHPSTPAATDLLLLLDTIVQAEQDALHVLLDTDPVVDLQLTRDSNVQAYRCIVRIRQEFRTVLAQRGLMLRKDLDGYYDSVRLQILKRVIGTAPGGYGANDARFLAGAIYWRAGHRSQALAQWRGLTASPEGSYAIASAALRATLRTSPIDDGQIDQILKNENGRWLSFSYDRLRRFGYRMDSY